MRASQMGSAYSVEPRQPSRTTAGVRSSTRQDRISRSTWAMATACSGVSERRRVVTLKNSVRHWTLRTARPLLTKLSSTRNACSCFLRSRGSCAYTRTFVSTRRACEPFLIELLPCPTAAGLGNRDAQAVVNDTLGLLPGVLVYGQPPRGGAGLVYRAADQLGLGHADLRGLPLQESILCGLDVDLLTDHTAHGSALDTSWHTSYQIHRFLTAR